MIIATGLHHFDDDDSLHPSLWHQRLFTIKGNVIWVGDEAVPGTRVLMFSSRGRMISVGLTDLSSLKIESDAPILIYYICVELDGRV